MILKKSHFAVRIVTAFCLISCVHLAGFSQTNKSLADQNAAARYQEPVAVVRELKPLLTASKIAVTGSSKNDRLKETLIDLEKKSWEAWQNRDGSFFQGFLSDDHVEVGFGGLTDKANVVTFVGSPVCTVRSYSVEQFKLTVFGPNTALLTYHAAQDTTCGGHAVPSPVWVSSLFIKRGNRWLNAVYQQTQTSK
jgi:hypothetical protein